MKKYLVLLATLFGLCSSSYGHTINYQLDKVSNDEIFTTYLWEGFKHIIPLGLDHILFILCIFFLNSNLKKIIWQATLFTVAHSVTLGLTVYNYIQPPAAIVEPIIALSIAVLAIENIFYDKVKPWRLAVIFLFGLIHGMGFAGALDEVGMPRYAFANALISFNVGVELGQLSVILLAFLIVLPVKNNMLWYKRWIVIPACLLIALVSGYWTIERLLIF